MDALTLDDLVSLEEFAGKRGEFFHAHLRYLDRYRRIRIGPRLTLVFENRQTLWFRVQEVVRVARLAEPSRVQQQLDLHNRLLPARDRLQAALVVAADETRLLEDLAPWRELRGDQLALHLGNIRYPANLLTTRPEDRAIGAAHWVQFVLDGEGRRLLADPTVAAAFVVTLPEYSHDSGSLSEDVRHSLSQDLLCSERD